MNQLFPPSELEAGDGDVLRLVLTVRIHGTWRACVEWGDGERRSFDSPFELARFVATPPRPPAPGAPRGLR